MEEKVNKLPNKSGVYLFKSKEGRILYIGKANDIQKRVKSHLKSSSNIYLRDEIINTNELEVDMKLPTQR